ncbi:hypothetical protein JW921_02225, partial [Candidatus Fermentibacterales bacterium]|nr:hypothetical protein [Candidatus Fermentibacterales bacterium]
MCEFCTRHAEGRKWYLEMRHYSKELLHQELTAGQREAVRAGTRLEWANRFWEGFVMPAILGVRPSTRSDAAETGLQPVLRTFAARTDEECMLEHYGQVLPLEDVHRVLEIVDSITRMPCGCRFLTTGRTDRRYCFGLGIDRW